MTAQISFIILAEVVFALLLTWGFMHEDIFVKFEDAVISRVKRFITGKKNSGENRRREKINRRAVYTPVKGGSSAHSDYITAA